MRFARAGGILLWTALLATLFGASLIYPVLGSAGRTANFTLPRGMDGAAYMAADPQVTAGDCTQAFGGSNAGDDQAIAWLNAHVDGSPVIVEAPGAEYSHCSRISAFTGLPTLLGWEGHEVQWRVNWLAQPGRGDILGQRDDAIKQIYTNPDAGTVMRLLRQYSVRLIYVGAAERQLYPAANLDRFASFLEVKYQHAGVTIYAVPEGGGR